MPPKGKKKDFDRQFEAFLKESFSSDDGSLDSAKVSKYLDPREQTTPKSKSKPWWMQSDDDDDSDMGANFGTGKTTSGKSFIKKKKPAEPKHSTPKQTNLKPVEPTTPELTPEERQGRQKARTGKKETKQRGGRGRGDTGTSMSKDSLEDISEKSEEDSNKDRHGAAAGKESSFGSDKTSRPGLETLDEIRDKEKFFQDLERNADGTLDYQRLNQDLSQSATTMSPEGAAKTAATLAALEDIEEDKPLTTRAHKHFDPQQSDEQITQDPSQKPSMLSKVSLMDSLESTMNTTGSPMVGRSGIHEKAQGDHGEQGIPDEVDGPGGRQSGPHTDMSPENTIGFLGTTTSHEIEALHKALREVGLSPTIHNDSQPFDLSSQGNRSTTEMVQKILSGEPGKQRNVEEILKEMEQLEKKSKENQLEDLDVELLSERRRSPYSPKSPRSLERQRRVDQEEGTGTKGQEYSPVPDSARGFDQSHTEDTERYNPVTQVPETKSTSDSIMERGRQKKKKTKPEKTEKVKDKTSKQVSPRRRPSPRSSLRGSQSRSPSASPRRWMSPRSLSKDDPRSRSLSPSKIGLNSTKKFSHVKSSGYGQKSPPKGNGSRPHSARDPYSREEDGQSPAPGEEGDSGNTNQNAPVKTKKKKDKSRSSKFKHQSSRKQQAHTWSPAEVTKQKIKGSDSPVFSKERKGHNVMETQLKASVDSFAQYIKDHFAESDMPQAKYSEDEPSLAASWRGDKTTDQMSVQPDRTDQDWKVLYEEEKAGNTKLKADMLSMEKEYDRMLESQKLEFEDQIFKLKQEVYVLSAKVPDSQSEIQKRLTDRKGEVSPDQMEKLDREIQEQEKLIAGYQQENKRLYEQLKDQKKQVKVTEDRMFTENQKMATEITNLRTKLERKEDEVRSKGIITSLPAQQNIAKGDTASALGAGRIAQLTAELREAKRLQDNSSRELEVLQRSKIELEQHIDQLIKERESLRQKVAEAKSLKSEEARVIEDKFKSENDRLTRKLKWYAENQKLLDSDAKRLKQQEEEIAKHKLRIEHLTSETGRRLEDNKVRAKERANDAKRIQDLQRQVKEMEGIIRRRHPNSLPALIMTAAVAPDDQPVSKTPTMSVLENRVKKLELELEGKDIESEKMLRSVEQKYLNIKVQYEERIRDLEAQLAIYVRPEDNALKEYEHPHTHAVALQKELDSVRDRYKARVAELTEEVSRLNGEIAKISKGQEVSLKNEQSFSKNKETEYKAQIQKLQQDLDIKSHDLAVAVKSVERLRKEKNLPVSASSGSKGDKNRKGKQAWEEEEALSLTDRVNRDKQYQPNSFADSQITETLQENEYLRSKVEQLQLAYDEQRLELRKLQAESESMARKSRENFEERINVLRSSHQKEFRKMLADQALNHSTSRMAELQSKVDAHQVLVHHLKEKLVKAELDSEQVSILKIREAGLKTKVEKLQECLKEAKMCQTPEMKHFESIHEKIVHMEQRHEQREKELQEVIRNAKQVASVELEQEVQKWRKIVEAKNSEIQKFRTELDAILEVLRVLQRQGVVIPISASAS
ncbi:centrosomal protein of 162 kDa-like isoform X2 [Pecten maximus]|uniref:centrosomal protein of 162 kDa-like isoform X2 n=1 Tax=Pecten maximus TaxID=6579 RepID=UPI0014583776|nr:centrosomal protein of 162 kDa-like isoform X2 [Pecten maximus]